MKKSKLADPFPPIPFLLTRGNSQYVLLAAPARDRTCRNDPAFPGTKITGEPLRAKGVPSSSNFDSVSHPTSLYKYNAQGPPANLEYSRPTHARFESASEAVRSKGKWTNTKETYRNQKREYSLETCRTSCSCRHLLLWTVEARIQEDRLAEKSNRINKSSIIIIMKITKLRWSIQRAA